MKTKQRSNQFSFAALILMILILFSCQKKKQIESKTLRTCLSTDPATVDPRKNADVFSSSINFLMYEGLTRLLSQNKVELALAKSVDISEDGRLYTFHLREAYWTDGKPITAYDFEYSWKKVLDPQFGSPCSQIFFPIKNGELCTKGLVSPDAIGIKVLDPFTLQIELENPTPYFLSLISFCNFYPIPKHIEQANPNWFQSQEKDLVGSGPFLIQKWVKNKEIVLIKNPNYWDAKNVYLEEIVFNIISDGRTALHMFENKELDFVSTATTPLLGEDLEAMKRKNQLLIIPLEGLLFCTFNLEKYPYQNANIRKALSYAIDRKMIVENISHLSEKPATCCFAAATSQKIKKDLFPPFDPNLAKELFLKGLEELDADLNDLKDAFVLSYHPEEPYKKMAETLQEQWKKILGIQVRLNPKDHKSHLSDIMDKDYSMALYNCIAQYTDPTSVLDRFKYKSGKKNYPSFQNDEYIELLDKASKLNDPIEREKILDVAESLLMSEMPIAPIYHFSHGILMSPELVNVEFSSLSNLLFKKISKQHGTYEPN